jgi:hypothetical protein
MNTAFTLAPSVASNTDANWRPWGQAIHDAFVAVGLVQTSDTGQVNWATATAPLTGADIGYEVWRFDDALQATVPIFFKMTYGSGNGNTRGRVVLSSVGTGSNGAGTLTNAAPTNPMITLVTGTAGDTTARDCFFSGDGSGIAAVLFNNSASTFLRGMFAIDRTRDIDGTPNGNGISVVTCGQTNATNYWVWAPAIAPRPSGWTDYVDYWPAMIPQSSLSTTSDGTDTHVAPVLAAVPEIQQTKMALAYATGDGATVGDQTVTHLGAARTYKRQGNNLYGTVKGSSSAGCMIWWAD